MEQKKKRKNNILVIIIPILIFITLIGAGAYALRDSLIPTDHTKTNSSDQPTKTSASNGYVEQKGEEAAVDVYKRQGVYRAEMESIYA